MTMQPDDFFQGNEKPCANCEGWTDQVRPHRHGPNFWIFPSATLPGHCYAAIVMRQAAHVEEGGTRHIGAMLVGAPVATYCTCEGGQDPAAPRCWHATAAFAFELSEYRGSFAGVPYHDPLRYKQACEGSLKAQAVILWSAARQAAREGKKVENQRLVYALTRIVEALNVQSPEGLQLTINCILCFGMEFPGLHVCPQAPAIGEDTGPDEMTEEDVEAVAQEMYSPGQRALHDQAQEWARRGW